MPFFSGFYIRREGPSTPCCGTLGRFWVPKATSKDYMDLQGISCLLHTTYSLHCSSFLGLPFRFLNIKLVKPKKGTTMKTVGRP